jgi:hypothetical protein
MITCNEDDQPEWREPPRWRASFEEYCRQRDDDITHAHARALRFVLAGAATGPLVGLAVVVLGAVTGYDPMAWVSLAIVVSLLCLVEASYWQGYATGRAQEFVILSLRDQP